MGFLASILIRRHIVATVALPLAVGMVAAISMTLWINGDRSASAYERFLEYEQRPDLVIHLCTPEFDIEQMPLHLCGQYDASAEIEAMEALPELVDIGRVGWTDSLVENESGTRFAAPVVAVVDGDYDAFGRPLVVDGIMPDPYERGSAVVHEAVAREMGWSVGDELRVTASVYGTDARYPPDDVRIAAIVRSSDELVPSPHVAEGVSSLIIGPWWSADRADAAFTSFVAYRQGGASDADVEAALQSTFPDRTMALEGGEEPSNSAVSQDAADDERLALRALAVGVALAAAFFAAQATIRQTRRELDHGVTLQALGVTRGQLRGLAVRRWAPSAVLAIVVAGVGATALTALGPLGIGRRAPWSSEVVFAPAVVAGAAVAIAALFLGASAIAVRPNRRLPVPRRARALPPMPLPVWATVATLRPNLNRRSVSSLGTAILGTALAASAFIAASTISDSVDRVIASPALTGADFDVAMEAADERGTDVLLNSATAHDGVERASLLIGTTVTIGGEETWVHAFAPVEGRPRVSPVIVSGREPVAADEVAFGSLTMRELGLEVGDTVTIDPFVSGSGPWTAEVVGVALVNDLWEPTAGRGGIVAASAAEAHFPEETASVVVGFTDDEAGVAARAAFEGEAIDAVAPRSVHHVQRLDWVPFALAAIAALMAAVTFVHALYTTVRSQRSDLATYRVLGLTRARAVGVVVLESVGIAAAAVVLAIPIGLVVGRWGWELIVGRLGLAAAMELPVRGILVAVVAVTAVGIVVAGPIGRRATSGTIADALRSE